MNKQAVRASTDDAVAAYLAKGGKIEKAFTGETLLGYRGKDWARAAQGEKVATGTEIKDERERRALKAVANKDAKLLVDLLQGVYDKEIKFDIENDRIGPNGEIR